jgi:predicted Zn-dependent peptidase
VAESDDVNDVSVDRMLQRFPGLLTVTAELSEGGDLYQCESAILREIVELGRTGPDSDELEKAKLLWRLDRLLGRESSLGLAGHLAFWEFMDRLESGDQHEAQVVAATTEDIARVVRTYLDPEVRSSAWMLPSTT